MIVSVRILARPKSADLNPFSLFTIMFAGFDIPMNDVAAVGKVQALADLF